MNTLAVVLEAPERIAVREVDLDLPKDGDVVVEIEWTGVSTGTERLLFDGRMPPFPGMGYPLVPSYEAVGRVAGTGERVFVPGANCFGPIRGLFGGAAAKLVAPARRVVPVGEAIGEDAVLLALAATARHALAGGAAPDLVVGHGVLGRLIARLAIAQGSPAPIVWETNPLRAGGAEGYAVLDPVEDDRRDYRVICDASGDAGILDTLLARIAKGGEIVLAGFYAERLSFAFPPAFMREARLRVAAEWSPADMEAVRGLVASGALSLDGLVTHRRDAREAAGAYRTAFADPACLKMVLDWRALA